MKTQKEINQEVALYMDRYNQMAYRHSDNVMDRDEAVMIALDFWLNKSEERVQEIYSDKGIMGCVAYICSSVRIQLTSTRSRFYYENIKENKDYQTDISQFTHADGDEVAPLDNIEEDIDESHASMMKYKEHLDEYLKSLHWYERTLFEMNVVDMISLDKISAKTGISRNSIFTTVKHVKKKAKIYLRQQASLY